MKSAIICINFSIIIFYFQLFYQNIFYTATEYHLGLLKAKLAKYRSQLLEPSKKSEKGEGFQSSLTFYI